MTGKKTYGVGIIGAGFMGHAHSYNYLTMPLFYDGLPFMPKLVGICDVDLEKASALCEECGFEFATDNHRDLLGREDIHVVDVSTPTLFHCRQIMDAIEAGKHIHADKPLCATVAEANDIVPAAERAGIVNMVAYHYRFNPAMMKAKTLIAEGFLGRPISFRVEYYHSSNLDRNKPMGWKQDKAMGGGGVLIEMACHVLDLIYYLLGRYAAIRMESLILYPERPGPDGTTVTVSAEDHVLLGASMKNGAIGTIEVSKIMAGTNDDLTVALYGTKGAIRFDMMNPNCLYVYEVEDGAASLRGDSGFKALETINKDPESRSKFPGPRFPIGWLRAHVAGEYYFMRSVHDGIQATPSFRDGAYIQEVIEGIYRNERRTYTAPETE